MLNKTLLTDIGIEPSDVDIILEADSRLGDKIQKITGGVSLQSNIELVLNNARLASAIAVALSNL